MSDLRPGITVLIACHPARLRNGLLVDAVTSVAQQTLQPDSIFIVNDLERAGAGRTRQKLLRLVETEWIAWLDSDDTYMPKHLEMLMKTAEETDSVFVNSWFNAPYEPFKHFGKPLDPCNPHHTTITFLVRTELAQEVGFRESREGWPVSDEDWGHIDGIAQLCCARGLRMTHLAERTWNWRQEGQNTSGLPHAGDAK